MTKERSTRLRLRPSITSGGSRSSSLTSFGPGRARPTTTATDGSRRRELVGREAKLGAVDSTQGAPLEHRQPELLLQLLGEAGETRSASGDARLGGRDYGPSKSRSSRSSFAARRSSDIDASRAAPSGGVNVGRRPVEVRFSRLGVGEGQVEGAGDRGGYGVATFCDRADEVGDSVLVDRHRW